jgi:hypothetical protein
MEVVRHHREGEYPDPAEPFAFPHQRDEVFLLGCLEYAPSIHNSRQAVIEAGGAVGGNFEAPGAHGARKKKKRPADINQKRAGIRKDLDFSEYRESAKT